MQPNEIWLLARWATRIDELARSLRAAFSLGAESSRVTWELESRWVLFFCLKRLDSYYQPMVIDQPKGVFFL